MQRHATSLAAEGGSKRSRKQQEAVELLGCIFTSGEEWTLRRTPDCRQACDLALFYCIKPPSSYLIGAVQPRIARKAGQLASPALCANQYSTVQCYSTCLIVMACLKWVCQRHERLYHILPVGSDIKGHHTVSIVPKTVLQIFWDCCAAMLALHGVSIALAPNC